MKLSVHIPPCNVVHVHFQILCLNPRHLGEVNSLLRQIARAPDSAMYAPKKKGSVKACLVKIRWLKMVEWQRNIFARYTGKA